MPLNDVEHLTGLFPVGAVMVAEPLAKPLQLRNPISVIDIYLFHLEASKGSRYLIVGMVVIAGLDISYSLDHPLPSRVVEFPDDPIHLYLRGGWTGTKQAHKAKRNRNHHLSHRNEKGRLSSRTTTLTQIA